jgi:hypothetical protein
MNHVDFFRELIQEPAPAPIPEQTDALVQPLRDLAQALTERAAVGARVQLSGDGRRHHLALWPLHRPAYRSLMVTVQVVNGRGTVLSNPPHTFISADELVAWLAAFVRRPEFQTTLDELRAQTRDPVDARLERGNGMATLVHVSAELQETLDRHPADGEFELDLTLLDREPVPDPGALVWLNSAGVRFEIRRASITDRTVHLNLIKRA